MIRAILYILGIPWRWYCQRFTRDVIDRLGKMRFEGWNLRLLRFKYSEKHPMLITGVFVVLEQENKRVELSCGTPFLIGAYLCVRRVTDLVCCAIKA